jgi:hypothetical protein
MAIVGRVKKIALFLTRYATHVKEMAFFLTCLFFVQKIKYRLRECIF